MNLSGNLPASNVTGKGKKYEGKSYKALWIPSHPNARKSSGSIRAYEATGDPRKRKCPFCKAWDDPENMRETYNGSHEHPECRNEYNRSRNKGAK